MSPATDFTLSKKIYLTSIITAITLTITGCGFQLRGADGLAGKTLGKFSGTLGDNVEQTAQNAKMAQLPLPSVQLKLGITPEDFALKKSLTKQLAQLGSGVISSGGGSISPRNSITPTINPNLPSIQVSNIRLQNYQLRGILTEIRLVLSADVKYHVIQNGKSTEIINNIQVQRSYQYDQASVSTDNPQADQIKLWLYDNLAQRIADQYLAINLTQAKN